jgi:shikimate 5-dehydrogenase
VAQRAIAFEAKRGAKLTIQSTRAQSLNKLGCSAGGLDEIELHADYEILINATSAGMQGESSPIDPKKLLPGTLVLDAVMQETPLLREAKNRGCLCIPGKELFIHQALRQFAFWFPEIDPNLVRTTLRRYL